MYPPLSQFNANNPQQHIAAINSVDVVAATQLVPAKRKRATTTATSAPPTLAPRSYSAYAHCPPQSAAAATFSFPSTSRGPPPLPPPSSSSSLQRRPPSSAGQQQHTNNVGGSDDIHCICGYEDDDGYTIACDDCERWSHMVCFDISVGRDPPEWRCWECAPRPVNRERARERQAARVAAQALGRLGPFVGTPEAEAMANAAAIEARQRKRRDRKSSVLVTAPPLSAAHSGGGGASGVGAGDAAEDEHIDIEDDWRGAYVPLTDDMIPHAATRTKLRLAAQNWRGVTALSPEEPGLNDSTSQTKVVPLPNGKDDVAAAVRPPSYGLQTTAPIPVETLITPFTSTVIPSAKYLADPLNAYAQMGMPKPHVHLVPPPMSVALDARMAGNEARFIRSGCRPNAVLRPVLCPSKQKNGESEPGILKFAVFALRDLKASEEVVLSWEWDDGAVVHQLPALIEEGLRSGAGPSKMTPHHINRLRLQMQSIVESLKSSFVTCACGSAARDCAVRLMEAFTEGDLPWLNGLHEPQQQGRETSPKVARSQNTNAQPGPSLSNSYSHQGAPLQSQSTVHQQPHQHQHQHAHEDVSQFRSPPPPSASARSTANRHPASLNELHELSRYTSAKARARLLGPLVGTERGVRTRVVGGPDSGGMRGVQQTSGDRWDRFGELDVGEMEGEGSERGKLVPKVRLQKPTPRKEKGKEVVRGPNGVGLGLGLEASYEQEHPRSPSPLVSGSTGDGEGEEVLAKDKEENMPPRLRKRWIQQKSETLKNDYPSELDGTGSVGGQDSNSTVVEGRPGHSVAGSSASASLPDEMDVDDFAEGSEMNNHPSINNSPSTPTPTSAPTPSTLFETRSNMVVDSDVLQMPPPPPPPTATSILSMRSPRISTSPMSEPSLQANQDRSQSQIYHTRSSLFSLLNEHPVSPLHTSNKYLAQVMNPPSPVLPPMLAPASEMGEVLVPVPPPSEEQTLDTEGYPEPESAKELPDSKHEVEDETIEDYVQHVVTTEAAATPPAGDESRRSPEAEVAVPSAESPELVAPSPSAVPSAKDHAPSEQQQEDEEEKVAASDSEISRDDNLSTSELEELVSKVVWPGPAIRSDPANSPTLARERSPSHVAAVEDSIASSAHSRARSPSPAANLTHNAPEEEGRSISLESSVQEMPTHDVHGLGHSGAENALLFDLGVNDSPVMLFKEELMEAAAELARSSVRVGDGHEVKAESVAEMEVENESEGDVEMAVDESLRVPERQSSPSPSPPVTGSGTAHVMTERGEMDIEIKIAVDVVEEMHDDFSVRPSSPQETHTTHTPGVVEVETSPPPHLRGASSSLSPRTTLSHSPRVETKSWSYAEPDSNEKQPIVASTAATVSAVPPEPAPENVPSTINADASKDAHLVASPKFLRAPSPAMSNASSSMFRQTPPPFGAPSDNEHEHEHEQGHSQVSESASAPGGDASSAPTVSTEPQKVRRSMADYRQRKRKQREEEAAKAALASPISPLHQELPRIDAPNGIDVVLEKTSGGEEPEKMKEVVEGQQSKQNGELEIRTAVLVGQISQDPILAPTVESLPISVASQNAPRMLSESSAAQKEAVLSAPSPTTSIAPRSPEVPIQIIAEREPFSPKREMSEEHVDFSLSPEVYNRASSLLKLDIDAGRISSQDPERVAQSPPPSPTKDRQPSPQLEEDGEILSAPPRTATPPTEPRAHAALGKATSALPEASTFSNARTARISSGGQAPPTQPRSFRDDYRVISTSPPPRYSREPPPPSASGKSKLAGWVARERAVATGGVLDSRSPVSVKEPSDKDKKADAASPIAVRRASSYVPEPPKPGSSAASGPPSASSTTPTARGPPPRGPRALRLSAATPVRVQPSSSLPRAPLAQRVERDLSRDREIDRGRGVSERDRERDRDRDRNRERDHDRYSPPRDRHAGRGRYWGRGRR